MVFLESTKKSSATKKSTNDYYQRLFTVAKMVNYQAHSDNKIIGDHTQSNGKKNARDYTERPDIQPNH